MTTQIQRRAFTVDEYHAMAEAGILTREDRVELLDGEIIAMVPIGSRRASCVDSLSELLFEGLQGRAILRVQGPVRLDAASEPQPDLMLLKRRDYSRSHPGPDDALLLIEVSDTTIDFDRNEKLPIYARSGIPEVWIVNLDARSVEVYSAPVNGEYAESRLIGTDGSLTPTRFEDMSLPVSRVIPG